KREVWEGFYQEGRPADKKSRYSQLAQMEDTNDRALEANAPLFHIGTTTVQVPGCCSL
ncbi:hypothetical protein CEXT_582321, partial [Caerostris extrusa]